MTKTADGMPPEKDGDASKPRFLNQYLPPELVSKLEAARALHGTAGERRVITMLFCDVKGSTAAAEQVDPEVWTEVMNGVFEHMIRPIYQYEGLVSRLMGDAILAFFGAPIAHEDDPQRAILAALDIQQKIKAYAGEIRVKHGLELGLRIGINTGLVMVGEIGSDLRMEYTAIGDAINLAARMEQTAAAGTIQITEDTHQLVAPFFETESLGAIEVKGKTAAVNTFRVLGTRAVQGQARGLNAVMGERLSSPLVGRDLQLVLLNEHYEKLTHGEGSLVAVTGEAGLGKSTLASEFKKLNEGSHAVWLRGEALSYARSISYFPWRQVMRQAIDAREEDSPAEVRHKLDQAGKRCNLSAGDIPFLEAMLAVESDESLRIVTGTPGDALVGKMAAATRDFLCGRAAEAPLVVVFEDLHWADEASLNLLLNVVDLCATQPLLLICLSRPDQTAASWDAIRKMGEKCGDGFLSIELEPLAPEQTDMLLANLMGMQDLPKKIRDLIIERSDGNPFFIEEIIRSLIETKQIVRQNGHWRAVGDEAKVTLPNTLRGLLGARIDRLPETSKHVLQHAAVIGRLFDLRILKRLTGLNGGLDAHIQALEEASLIEALSADYAFRHVLIQEAAYESILIKTRTGLHRQIGEALEEFHANRIEEFAPVLAHHYYSAGDGRSLKYDVIAGEKAARLYANTEAATHFSRALEVAKQGQVEYEQIARLQTRLGSVLELGGRYPQALTAYDELLALGIRHHDRAVQLSALMAKATLYSTFTQAHNPELSEKTLIQALQISQEIGDLSAQARLNWNLMLNYLFSKRLDQSLGHGEAALALARKSDHSEYLAFVLNDLCRLYTCRGEFDRAHASIREARELWRSLDNQVMLADSLGSEAEAYFNAGEFERSLEYSQRALQISVETNNLWGQAYDGMLMSFVYFETGQLGHGIQIAHDSIRHGDEAGLIASNSLRAELAWIYAYCGAFEKGFPLIEQALQDAEEKYPDWKRFPQALKVRMLLLQGDLRSAEQTAGNAILEPITIPYARYTILVFLANVELAAAKGEFARALSLADDLLQEVTTLTYVDVPDVLRWRGEALLGLNRLDEAHQTLTEARSQARSHGTSLHLLPIALCFAAVNSKMGREKDAEDSLTEGRNLAEQISDSLRQVGLRDSFMNQPRLRKLMR